MFVRLNNERHNLTLDNSLVVSFRKKEWRYMNNVLHFCDDDCLDKQNKFIIYNVELIKRCRAQRFDEFVRWEPRSDDWEDWDTHVKQHPEREVQRFRKELEGGINWEELE